MTDLSPQAIHPLIRHALKEDAASRDATSRAVIPATLRIRARILAKAHGIAAGVKVAALAFTTLDPSLRCRLQHFTAFPDDFRSGAIACDHGETIGLGGGARTLGSC